MRIFFIVISVLFTAQVHAQKGNQEIMQGNEAYHKGDFTAAVSAYKSALKKDPASDIARFNLANALQRESDAAASQSYYDDIIQSSQLNSMKAASQYNKGLAYLKDKKLNEAIAGFKNSLKLDPNDDEARENLQKALNEKNKQQQQQQNQQQNKKQQTPPKDKKQPPPPKLNQQMMQQKFNELRNEEKQLQQKLQDKQDNTQQEKDW